LVDSAVICLQQMLKNSGFGNKVTGPAACWVSGAEARGQLRHKQLMSTTECCSSSSSFSH
jgi:hypothetical protein